MKTSLANYCKYSYSQYPCSTVTGEISYNTTKTLKPCFWGFIPFYFLETQLCIYLQMLYEYSDNNPAGDTRPVTKRTEDEAVPQTNFNFGKIPVNIKNILKYMRNN